MSNETAFGLWLKQRRTRLGWTLQQLAARASCSTVLVRKIESGERTPSEPIALALADCFAVPADEHPAFLAFAQAGLPAARLAELTGADGTAPWRAFYSRMVHLPTPATAFIGRADAVAAAAAALRAPRIRLLTVIGPPGMGKTRFGLRVAETLAPAFPDGVIFVGLAAIRDPGQVPGAIARALDVRESGSAPLLAALIAHLGDKRLLLVLDNFEQVIPAAIDVAALLNTAPRLKVLVTSRQPLRVRGERAWPLPPLTAPAPGNGASRPAAELARYEAVQLFVARARAANPDFALSDANAAAVVALCRALDHLPLAIELAAARAPRLTPGEMLATLRRHLPGGDGAESHAGGRLRLLADGPRDLAPRQQTLRGAVDWSYDLLDAGERRWFAALAVFSGGCAAAAARVVIGGDEATAGMLRALADKSLLQVHDVGGASRFMMLETIREYAREKLEERGEAEALERAHAGYYTRLAEEAESHLSGSHQQDWLARLEAEYDNIGAALDWAMRRSQAGDPAAVETALRLACAFWRFWYIRGNISAGRGHLDGVLALAATLGFAAPGTAPPHALVPPERWHEWQFLLARVLNGAGALAARHTDFATARARYEQSLVLRQAVGDRQGVAGSLNNLGGIVHLQGDFDQARALFLQSLAIKREVGDQRGIAYALNSLGTVAYSMGDDVAAWRYYEESLAIKQALGDQAGIALTVDNLGQLAYRMQDYPRARAYHEQSLAIRRALGDKWGIGKTLSNLGDVAYQEGDYATARACYEESVAFYRDLGDQLGLIESLEVLARLASTQGRPRHAAQLWGAAEAARERIQMPLHGHERPHLAEDLAAARAALAPVVFEQAWQAGRGMLLAAAIAAALAGPPGLQPRPPRSQPHEVTKPT
jgi:predicted ATPase/transcriptional regulator with XRE-family HTH domain/Tfp pilus assembly protein PilF